VLSALTLADRIFSIVHVSSLRPCAWPTTEATSFSKAFGHRMMIRPLISPGVAAETGPFVPQLAVGARPEQLLESRFFWGTNAARSRGPSSKSDHIELSTRGVLFLDE